MLSYFNADKINIASFGNFSLSLLLMILAELMPALNDKFYVSQRQAV
jgi:hypothetical protein